jgi:hypothetical protein
MKTISALVVGGVWAMTEPTTAVLFAGGIALFAALLISVRRA